MRCGGERSAMGYLHNYEHDIFVSYAHADLLNDWSKRLVDEVRKYVAGGLGMRQTRDLDVWMDYKISGNEPLTGQLRSKVEKSGVLLVLMSEWYLESSWCRDELGWFFDAIRQKRADRPVFVVRARATDHNLWPDIFKDERGHPLVGYDFVRDADDDDCGLPKGYPVPASEDKEFYDAVRKLASGIVTHLKSLARGEARKSTQPVGEDKQPTPRQRVFLAAVPAEDVDDVRDELADLLGAQGCIVVPETNPLDVDKVHEQASEWVSNCDKFVQVLGRTSGSWRHDDTGFVMYQHELAKKNNKPIFVYRAPPSLETSRVKKPEYREFLERFDKDDTGGLQSFAERVAKVAEAAPSAGGDAPRSVFMMASARDESLEREIRRLLRELDIAVFPLARSARGGREVASVLDEGSSFLEIVKRCGAILLINGTVKQEDDLWIDGRVADIKFDIQRKLGNRLKCAIVDAPIEPRLESFDESFGDVSVFRSDSPTLRHDLQGWLQKLQGGVGSVAGGGA
jgi:TIR domain